MIRTLAELNAANQRFHSRDAKQSPSEKFEDYRGFRLEWDFLGRVTATNRDGLKIYGPNRDYVKKQIDDYLRSFE